MATARGTGDGGKERSSARRRGYSRPVVLALVATLAALGGLAWAGIAHSRERTYLHQIVLAQTPMHSVLPPTSAVFTTAHASFYDAVREFFNLQSTPVQPIAFNHSIHIQKGLKCATCHTGVTQGPDAGIPSTN
jgi:hypothetical protein